MSESAIVTIRAMVSSAHALAASDSVLVRVAGERVSSILADLLYEIDVEADEVFSLMPVVRRDAPDAVTDDGAR